MLGFLSKAPAPSSAKSRNVQLGVESLEERKLMSATRLGNVVTIEGSGFSDRVVVQIESPVVSQNALKVTEGVTPPKQLVVYESTNITGTPSAWKVTRFNAADIRLIEFYGFSGSDYFRNDTSIRAYAEGGSGNDTLIGGRVTDEFYGGIGHDRLIGRQGVDYLSGDAGNDRLDGGADGVHDELQGGAGADTFVAERFGIFNTTLGKNNRDNPLDFNAREGDRIDWGQVLTMR